MKKCSLLIIVCFVFLQPSICCTTFFINQNGQLVFGRNYDWVTGAGIVCTNLRGLDKTSLNNEYGNNAINWISKYGSITFNQYGKEFPTGGMNEKGLVVELMWAEGSRYPKPDKRPALDVLQWIQYQLDNNETIEEVIATDAEIRIAENNPPLHYLIADANGNAATVEFFNGKMVVHTGKDLPFPVLTNNPYSESAGVAIDAKVLAGNTNFYLQDNSLQRFTQACSMIEQLRYNKTGKPVVEYAFDILHNVDQGEFTKWSIVYDLKNMKVYFKTAAYQGVKSFTFNAFDFTCSSVAKVLNMNQSLHGDIAANFRSFNADINRMIIEKSVEESKSRVPISAESKEMLVTYATKIKCKE